MTNYDYLVVGAGLTGSVIARELADASKRVLVIDRRHHIGGNCYTESIRGINVHKYGAHIFHTSDKYIWEYVNRFATFNNFRLNVMANYHGVVYNLPFNMNTFSKMWGVSSPADAARIIERQREEYAFECEPKNLEEQAISLVGRDIYEALIKEYVEKQWGRDSKELPASIIRRLPVRFTYDNDYYGDLFQGIPVGGYTKMFEKMLNGIDVRLGIDYFKMGDIDIDRTIFTGPIDEYFHFALGHLDWRTLQFEEELLEGIANYQGTAAMSFTSHDEPYTRIIEHKHFEFGRDFEGNELPDTVITREYSSEWEPGDEPYYPVNNERNNALYEEYAKLAAAESGVIFAGRLGRYRYYDMAPCIADALRIANDEIARKS